VQAAPGFYTHIPLDSQLNFELNKACMGKANPLIRGLADPDILCGRDAYLLCELINSWSLSGVPQIIGSVRKQVDTGGNSMLMGSGICSCECFPY